MQPTLIFTLFILAAYLLASLLCALLGDPLAALLQVPEHKIIGRGGLLLALIGLWPLLKSLNMLDRALLGYGVPAREFRRHLLFGLGVGVAILACLGTALWGLGIRAPSLDAQSPALLKVLAQGLLGGLAVGFIEETFFRGALQGGIRRRGGGTVVAVLLPSLLYAALHFLKPQQVAPQAGSCLASLAAGFPALFRMENLDSFVALTLVGLFLSLVRERCGHIGWGIGLHAGWVLVIKLIQSYSDNVPHAPLGFLTGSYDGVIGWLAAGWIGLLALVLALWPRRGSPSQLQRA
jgi:membrane protease YdiL (CAAX protease family)